ncbi:HD-GYP domain-containing protein [Cohnella faecalis]|uniref:HD-GYP domain-containing protein n=2 Tax=Cohnella faecalis TaxID=2315694 RepID=A0A398CWQ7_9BACL|nr:HD-GYP domain-containing protein [Cohnella faecalis]RIE04267.1 HD-GYP domain-containing protein [Cohnella faecalis]
MFGVILTLSAYLLVTRQIVDETGAVTQSAVDKHFAVLPQLQRLFTDASVSQEAPFNRDATEGHNHEEASPATDEGNLPHNQLESIIRMHFDLYNIQDVVIYDLFGRVLFSYDDSRLNGQLTQGDRLPFKKAIEDGQRSASDQRGILHLWIPIQDSEGRTVGALEALRDISDRKSDSLGLIALLALLSLAGMLVLFFALRQLFIRSSRTIDSQNRELSEMVERIRRTYDESLQALSSALDSRDNETRGHSQRVTAYAWMLGKQLGLDEERMEWLIRGALLHDVGKIGIPDAILLKNGPLTEEEWVVMKGHVSQGVQMLRSIEFLGPSLDVVGYHHERWDGHGYPNGLQGEQIPLAARIFSVCDTYDAMTSDRPYRAACTHEEAILELQKNSGTQFSPAIVDAFLQISQEKLDSVRDLSKHQSLPFPLTSRDLSQVG